MSSTGCCPIKYPDYIIKEKNFKNIEIFKTRLITQYKTSNIWDALRWNNHLPESLFGDENQLQKHAELSIGQFPFSLPY